MARWQDFADAAPEMAARVQAVCDAHLHKTVATLRRDGAPRISGNEARFADGELWLGMMPGSVKARDIGRDPRVAIHSATVDEKMIDGDAKIAGRAWHVTDEASLRRWLPEGMAIEEAIVFAIDVTEVVLTRIGDPADHLLIESWTPERGVVTVKRA